MSLRGIRCPGMGGKPGLALVGFAALAACSPIETYRSFVGVSINDPDPKTSPFTQNLAAGERLDYPNLATVPPPPTRATSTAERQKLTETLVANRTDAEASATAPVSPSGSIASATPRNLSPCQNPVAASSNPRPPSPPSRPTPIRQRKQGEPPDPQPLESTLQVPEMRAVPEPEAPCATLPLPNLPPASAVAAATPAPPPELLATAVPAPAPPVPVIADVPPPPRLPRPEASGPPPGTLVAALAAHGTPPRVEGDARAQIEHVAALYNAAPRIVRVVAYAAPGAPGAAGGEPLAGYHAALERAQAVAAALRAAGIPADKIQSEAAPASAPDAGDRVEIQLVP